MSLLLVASCCYSVKAALHRISWMVPLAFLRAFFDTQGDPSPRVHLLAHGARRFHQDPKGKGSSEKETSEA